MSQSKSFNLQIDLKDISGIPAGLTQCRIEVGGRNNLVDLSAPMVCLLDEVSATTVITVSLFKSGEAIGVCRVSFNAMFGQSLIGKTEKWVRLKEVVPAGRDLKVKLSAQLSLNEKTEKASKLSDLSLCRQRDGEEVRCPYIEKVADSETEGEKIKNMWSKRIFLGDLNVDRSIRITLEPETLNKPGTEPSTFSISSLASLDYQKLKEQTGFQLKKLLKSLNLDLKNNVCSTLNLPLARRSLIMKVEERMEKHKEGLICGKEVESISKIKSDELQALALERSALVQRLVQEEKNCRLLENEVDALKSSITFAVSDNIKLRAECIRYGDIDKVHKELQGQVKEGLMRKTALEKAFNTAESQLKSLKEKSEKQKERIRKEKENFSANLKELKVRKDSALTENNYLKRQLSDVKQRLNTDQNIKSLVKEARNSSLIEYSRRDQAYYDLQEFIHSLQCQSDDFKNKQKSLISGRKMVCQSISSLEHELESKENQMIDLRRRILENCSNQIAVEELYCIKSDATNTIDELTKVQKVHNEGRDAILKGLEQGVEHLLKETEILLDSSRELDCLVDSLDNKDYELDNLKVMVGESKTRLPPYLPKADDPVDVALAEYLNGLDKPMLVPFTRENEGIYMFGTKRLFLKLEHNNIRIRVGGGYTNIDEFIEIYTSSELEKQEQAVELAGCSDSLTRFIGTNTMSPQRAARIIQSSVEVLHKKK